MHFRNKRTPITGHQFYFNNSEMIQSSYKYLGTSFTEHLDFNIMCEDNTNKAKKAFNLIKQEWYNNGEMSAVIFKKILSASLFPICDYSCPQWSIFVNRTKKEVMNLAVARFFLGVSPLFPIPALENNMGMETATDRQMLKSIILYYRRVSLMEPKRYCFKIMNYMSMKGNHKSWWGRMYKIIWEYPLILCLKTVKQLLKRQLDITYLCKKMITGNLKFIRNQN